MTTKTNQSVQVIPAEFSEVLNTTTLPLTKTEEYVQEYLPHMKKALEFKVALAGLDKNKTADAEKAKRIRIDVGKFCSAVETLKKKQKADVLPITKFIDELYNKVEGFARGVQAEAKTIEEYAAEQQRLNEERLKGIRIPLIRQYVENPEAYGVEKLTDEAFVQLKNKLEKEWTDAEIFRNRIAEIKKQRESETHKAEGVVEITTPVQKDLFDSNEIIPSVVSPVTRNEDSSSGGERWMQRDEMGQRPSGAIQPNTNFTSQKPSLFTPKRKADVKKMFYDLETTGTEPSKHGIHQISGLIEVNGEVAEEFNYKVRPNPKAQINEEALAIGNVTKEIIAGYPEMGVIYAEFTKLTSKYVDKFNKQEKLFLVGYNNAGFDDNFLRGFFVQNGDQFFGSRFWADPLDVRVLAAEFLQDCRHEMENFQLKTVARYLGIAVDDSKLHDAKYDIYLTREIYYKVTGRA